MKRTITELLEKGLIEPSTSAFGAPILFITKKGGAMHGYVCTLWNRDVNAAINILKLFMTSAEKHPRLVGVQSDVCP